MKRLEFSKRYAEPFLAEGELEKWAPAVAAAHKQLHEGKGPGSEFLGWLNLPVDYSRQELAKIKQVARKIQAESDLLIVIGIGGSYLGARAAVEMLSHSFYNLLPAERRGTPQILFAGNAISGSYLRDLLEIAAARDFSVNVISKSGTTAEPAIAFRAIKKLLEQKYGPERARRRIYATTDGRRGALREMAASEGYTDFVIPDDIGGRYSVLTPVGLLPMAVAGIDIEQVMEGAASARDWYGSAQLSKNAAYQYAALRNIFYRQGKTIEILINYEPALGFFNEWWKQLFGESEGKEHKGVFPAGVNFTTDLHSMGQFIQEGSRNIYATTLWVSSPQKEYIVPESDKDADGLNYLAGRSLSDVNYQAFRGTILAHTDGGVPNLVLEIPALNAFYFGCLVYFFQKACAVSGYLLGINPFDQPGVDAYKQNMAALLGRPGFEEQQKKLLERLQRGGTL